MNGRYDCCMMIVLGPYAVPPVCHWQRGNDYASYLIFLPLCYYARYRVYTSLS